jgi:hypothetical protein
MQPSALECTAAARWRRCRSAKAAAHDASTSSCPAGRRTALRIFHWQFPRLHTDAFSAHARSVADTGVTYIHNKHITHKHNQDNRRHPTVAMGGLEKDTPGGTKGCSGSRSGLARPTHALALPHHPQPSTPHTRTHTRINNNKPLQDHVCCSGAFMGTAPHPPPTPQMPAPLSAVE